MPNPLGGRGKSLGLTVGATNLAGAGDGQRPVIRPAAMTLQSGAVLTGFVDRVGDPIPMVAQDGTQHRPEVLLAEALDGLARNAANAAPVSEVGVTVPAHWRASMVDALRGALQIKPGLSRSSLISDAAAAVTALRATPGLPSAGVIVLCDFGGSGTSITLIDTGRNDAPIGETVRVPDFSGDQIDQAILTKVVTGIFDATDADPSGTAMVGSLSRLRDECRRAKERLSDETATAIGIDLPGIGTNVRMTRMEIDDLIAGPLDEFVAVLLDTLDRNRVPLATLSAVATIGGGARIPLITQRLSEHLRTSVITTPHPQFTAAEGVALIAQRARSVETATAMAPAAAPATATVSAAALDSAKASPAVAALAWSEVEDDPHDALHTEPHFEDDYVARPADVRPDVHFSDRDWEEEDTPARRRGPVLLFGLAAAAAVVAAVVFGLTFTHDASTVPAGTTSGIAPSPASVAGPAAPASEAPAQAPAQAVTTVVSGPQPRVVTQQQAQAPVVAPAPEQPAPAPEQPAPAPAPEQPAPAPAPAPAQAPAPENPAPQNSGTPTNPGTAAPPIDSGTGGTGPGTSTGGTGSNGTGTGGTATGSGATGSGATGAGTGSPTSGPGTGSSSGSGSGTGAEAGTGSHSGGGAKTPHLPGLISVWPPGA